MIADELKRKLLAIAVLAGTLILGVSHRLPSAGQVDFGTAQPVAAELIADVASIRPGRRFALGVELSMSPGWHTYYREPGDSGMPTRIDWSLPAGFSHGELQWQPPQRFEESGLVTRGYEGNTVIATVVTPPAQMKAGQRLDFEAKVKWLACKDLCVPGSATVKLSLPVKSPGASPEPVNQGKFASVGKDGSAPPAGFSVLDQDLTIKGTGGGELSLLACLAFALVGGFILNFMPCVLPVISLKVLGFMEQAGEDPRRVLGLGLSFTAGIVGSALTLGLIVAGLKAAGQQIGWGFQFQNPWFVIAMAVIVLVLSLSLFGLFYLQLPGGSGTLDMMATREGLVGSFFKGVLATVLATPCSAPFLGTAVGFAFSQPAWMILSVFAAVGLGMAFPYLLLTANPAWMKHIPRPGAWMERFKEAMGFLLLATVVWLLWILGNQLSLAAVINVTSFLVCVSFAAWLVGRLTDLTSSWAKVAFVWSAAAGVVGLGFYLFLVPINNIQAATTSPRAALDDTASGDQIHWLPFSLAELNSYLASGKTVFLDFTADWCLTCKANEMAVIDTPAVRRRLQELDVVTMKADWTRQNPEVTALLERFGRSGVPLYVIFPGDSPQEPIVLPEVITQPLLLDRLSQAERRRR